MYLDESNFNLIIVLFTVAVLNVCTYVSNLTIESTLSEPKWKL